MATSTSEKNAIGLESLPHYAYSPLSDPARNIRVIELLPGNHNDDVRIRIKEVTLEGPNAQEPSGRLLLEELRATIPQDTNCRVRETTDGRFFFTFKRDGKRLRSWIHPSPNFDRTKYFFPEPVRHGEPMFEALSYAWGIEPDEAFVVVEGGASCTASTELPSIMSGNSTTLRIRPNLSLILRNLRQKDESRTLWIDAICINQADEVERGVQVRQMANIYALAYSVVIWMGLPSETYDTRRAIEQMAYVARQVEITTENMRTRSPDAGEDLSERWFDENWDLPFTPLEFGGIRDLLDRDWVHRLWVIQEVHLANRCAIMQWGSHSITVREMRRAVRCLDGKRNLPFAMLREAVSDLGTILNIQHGAPLPFLLFKPINAGCADPKDRVYGILGMAPPQVAGLIKPDYSAASTAENVYRDTFLAHMKLTKRLEMFLGTEPNPSRCWPSWVPDWDANTLSPRVHTYIFSSGCSRTHYSYEDTTPKVLHVLGVRSAVVSWAEEEKETNETNDIKLRVNSLLAHCQAGPTTSYTGGGSMGDALAWTVVGGWCYEDFGSPHATLGESWHSIVNSHPMGSSHGGETLARKETRMIDTCASRIFIGTQQGYIGLCPVSVKNGEIELILLSPS